MEKIKQMWNTAKEWVKNNTITAVGIGAALGVAVWYFFLRNKKSKIKF